MASGSVCVAPGTLPANMIVAPNSPSPRAKASDEPTARPGSASGRATRLNLRKGPAPSEEEHNRVNLYKRLGSGGVDFPAVFRILRERNYDGWISLDFNAADMPPGVTIEQDMAGHRKYLVETLHATMRT